MTPLIPRSALFGNPEQILAAVSPDGTMIAFAAPLGEVLNLFVGDVTLGNAKPVTADTDRGVRTYQWARDSRHLLYLQDSGGDENWHLHRVDVRTGEDLDLTPIAGVQAAILATSPRVPGEVLVALNDRDPRWHDVHRLDVATGRLTLDTVNPGFGGWLADDDLQVRAATKTNDDGSTSLMLRDTPDREWRIALTVDFGSELSLVRFSGDGGGLFVITSAGANASRLVLLDAASEVQTVLAEDPQYDVSSVLFERFSGRPLLARVVRERAEIVVLDEAVTGDVARLADMLSGDVEVVSQDDADRLWVVAETRDDAPLAYHLFDRATGGITRLFGTRPRLEGVPLAPMEPFAFTASDGLEVHGYLTFPVEGARRDLPAVLVVHGGPWARDYWGFNPTAQWLANRGYVCVQVNYRGSTGYGKAFHNAGDKEWGGKMHQDLVDAVHHLIGKGWIDPERVGIYGGSYGGYAALCGATFTPDLFRCAVDIVGPSNLQTLIESCPPYWVDVARMFRMRAVDPDTEPELVRARSPLFHVDKIKIPLLIAQGANDPRVKQSESEQIVAAMRDRGIPHEYLLFPDEGHGFAKPVNDERFRQRAEAFLGDNLGGAVEP